MRALLYDELKEFVAGLGVAFSDGGAVHSCARKEERSAPVDCIVNALHEGVARAGADDADGSKSRPFDFPEHGESPVNETTTPGY